ncbi:MAG: CPBP family intramembrane glutamic endopeptidase [Paracoccaceae bacterium]
MTRSTLHADATDVPLRLLLAFLLIAFGLAWGLFALLILVPEQLEVVFGPVSNRHPLFIFAVYAPAIAAFTLVLRAGGWVGLARFLSRLLLWRCPWPWYAVLLIGIPALFFAGSAVKGDLTAMSFAASGLGPVLGAMAFMAVLGPMEEFGWRGFALPLLQRKMVPFWASVTLGLIWGIWHLPAFLLGGTPQNNWSFVPFFIGTVAISLIVTPMFNAAKGSILLPALMHFQLNNPLWPDAQPYDTIFFAAAAGLAVWLNRDTMFSGHGAVTAVIPAFKTAQRGRARPAEI